MKDKKYWIRLVTGFISIYVIAGIIADWIKGRDTHFIIVPVSEDELKETEIVP